MQRPEINRADIELACRSAVARWKGLDPKEGEGTLAEIAQRQPNLNDQGFLTRWLNAWTLVRTSSAENREAFGNYLTQTVRPALKAMAKGAPNYAQIRVFAQESSDRGFTYGRATSLMSKFGLSIQPLMFSPYDHNTLTAMKKVLGLRIPEHDYVSFMGVFQEFASHVARETRARHSHVLTLASAYNLDEDLLLWRGADKLLMILGDFDPKRMEAEAANVHLSARP